MLRYVDNCTIVKRLGVLSLKIIENSHYLQIEINFFLNRNEKRNEKERNGKKKKMKMKEMKN